MQRLLAEMWEQPQVLRRLIEHEYAGIKVLAQEIKARQVEYVLIAARGSSDNAATYAKYLLGMANGIPVALAAPSMYTLYERVPRLHNALVLAISQSGMSPDIVSVIQDARAQGMLTVALTNEPGSRLAQAAERLILCRAGEERSVAATKTYTAELMALALLSVALSDDDERLRQLKDLPDAVARTLDLAEEIESKVERYRYIESCAVIGRGYNYATAFEAALKIKELTYCGANPYSSADFTHGPIAVVGSGYPVFLFAPEGRVFGDMLALGEALRQRHAELVIFSDRDEALALAQTPLRLAATVDEWLSPLTAIIPAQLFAYYLARSKGHDPERPRGLQKVTETR